MQALAQAFPETFADGGIGAGVAAFVSQAPDVQRLRAAMGPGVHRLVEATAKLCLPWHGRQVHLISSSVAAFMAEALNTA